MATESTVAAEGAIALTPAQRLHLNVYGYVLLEDVLTPAEIEQAKAALYQLKAEPDERLEELRVYRRHKGQHHVLLGHLVEYDPALLAYAVHPKLVPLVEEVVGGSVRLEESEAIINRRNPEASPASLVRGAGLQFHDGTRHGWGTWEEQGNFHCLFVKTLVYLTDVGPDDGGTSVIPGSHKLSWPPQESIAAAQADGRLIHQIEAKAGSVLLFPESLLHSTTPIRSDTERVILVAGYTPPMLREWPGNEISPEFVATLPEHLRPLISGSDSWHWQRRG